jgi:hypothetical protein
MLSLVYDDGAGQVSSIYWPNPYFSYWQNSRKIYNFSRQAQLDSSGHFLASDNATFDAADLGAAGVTRRLALDTDGNLRLYSLDAHAQTWTVSWMAFPNPCIIHGVYTRCASTRRRHPASAHPGTSAPTPTTGAEAAGRRSETLPPA